MSTLRKRKEETELVQLDIEGKSIDLPVLEGSEGEKGLDISALRKDSGYVTLDDGFVNTASCQSGITFLDGEKGILRYRGYPIEQLAEKQNFLDTAYLVIKGDLPNTKDKTQFLASITQFNETPKEIKNLIRAFPKNAHPMAILSSVIGAYAGFFSKYIDSDPSLELRAEMMGRLIAEIKNIAAHSYHHSLNQDFLPSNLGKVDYSSDFLQMMFGKTPDPIVAQALNILLILHADHEQNCSTSTVRLVGSSKVNVFSSVAAGINALWGPLHGGANQAVIEMLEAIHNAGGDYKKFLEKAKDKNDTFRLMGFGHRVYKNFDPRAKIIKTACDDVLKKLGIKDPLLSIAKGLEEEALKDEYFVSRKLYPNVDFYSGIIYKALNIPTNFFTVMFAIGRLPGWLAQWEEMRLSSEFKIGRPRQIYVGHPKRDFK